MKKIISKILLSIGVTILIIVCYKQQNINEEYQNFLKEKTPQSTETNNKNIDFQKNIDWKKLNKTNKDIIAWLYIPGTGVNYPVVKAKDNEYYLTHNIYKESSQYGSIFFDARYYNKNIINVNNLIIYGHNMGHWNNTMFGKLMKYKDKNYYNKHQKIYLFTKDKKNKYQIINVIKTTTKDKWYEFTYLDNCKYTVAELKENLNNKSLYNCNSFNKGTDKYITLSTCDYNGDYRIMIIGQKYKVN